MADISQTPGVLNITVAKTDDFTLNMNFGMDLTGYTFVSKVLPDKANDATGVAFTINQIDLAHGRIAISLTDTQIGALPVKTNYWYFKWTKPDATTTRKIIVGDFVVE